MGEKLGRYAVHRDWEITLAIPVSGFHSWGH
jgi:hypothetical protein